MTARTGACAVDRTADDCLGTFGRVLLETVGGSDLCCGMGCDAAFDEFSRFIDGCSTRKFPRGLDISVSGSTVGREPLDEGPRGLGGCIGGGTSFDLLPRGLAGWTPLVAVRTTSSAVGRLEIGSDAAEVGTLENEGDLGLCGRVCFDGTADLCS